MSHPLPYSPTQPRPLWPEVKRLLLLIIIPGTLSMIAVGYVIATTVHREIDYLDPETATRMHTTEWFGRATSTITPSPLDLRLARLNIPHAHTWITLQHRNLNIFGSTTIRTCTLNFSPMIRYQNSLQHFADSATPAEIKAFLRTMHSTDVEAQQAALDAATRQPG